MATSPDPTNLFNLCEVAAVNAVNLDTWLGDTDNVATVHAKIRRDENDDIQYDEAELPAIGMLAVQAGPDEVGTQRKFRQSIRLMCDIVVFDADRNAADALCKQIGARWRRLMRIQKDLSHAEASELDGFVSGNGDVLVNEPMLFQTIKLDNGWLAEGAGAATVITYSTE